ncbi:1,6-anhydro-N-acetylmuramyl-L-alanine amidase AmpD [Caldimonas caldifontis]|uniref:1,6-anhydro-N-acetylmuramyl-L-alanine amidase AmpD n=1 Tax=Caldimonas caldifontis TaxID=1452508 RepID=A0A2S5SYY2_9BURK|nr:1,6-anhydro-N-acetylmuramyl-L-alanine amidase AmpD [Caldimonas caldifontis]PPE67930.1 1,6-anhydro-N-acetylmuramyl-L-alanine amidase AmpD [Caldimonas caldifontis]
MAVSEPPRNVLWHEGWYRLARAVPSPNHGLRPPGQVIDLVILHSISLPPGRYGGDEIERFFTNTLDWAAHPYFETLRGLEVSAHFVVQRDGGLLQFVSCERRAWHAGRSSFQGRDNCNDFSIGIELEGLEGEAFAPIQYRTLVTLLRDLRAIYPVAHVTGHEHVAPGRKSDPGPAFDWAGLQAALGWPAVCFALSPT